VDDGGKRKGVSFDVIVSPPRCLLILCLTPKVTSYGSLYAMRRRWRGQAIGGESSLLPLRKIPLNLWLSVRRVEGKGWKEIWADDERVCDIGRVVAVTFFPLGFLTVRSS
jgi:hypothetical protein